MSEQDPKKTSKIMELSSRPPMFVRSIHAETLLEDFFVSAVASVLAIRFYLQLTGFPQLGFGPFHIAHILWGGLFMVVGLVILLGFLDSRAKVVASVLGGIGFGAFIDELGKFVTSNNDYFFQPAVALIYIVFVVTFFAIRAIGKRTPLDNVECLANIFESAKQGSLAGLDREELDSALGMLETCPPTPVREHLEAILRQTRISASRSAPRLERFHLMVDRFYEWAVSRWWFSGLIICFFALTAVTSLYAVVAVIEWSWGLALWLTAGATLLAALVWSRRVKIRFLNGIITVSIIIFSIMLSWLIVTNLKGLPISTIDAARLVFPSISGVLIVIGVMTLPQSRLQSYRMFRRAILVSIFFTQVLSFYQQQLLAVLGLIPDILILVALRYFISHEESKRDNTIREKLK